MRMSNVVRCSEYMQKAAMGAYATWPQLIGLASGAVAVVAAVQKAILGSVESKQTLMQGDITRLMEGQAKLEQGQAKLEQGLAQLIAVVTKLEAQSASR